MAGSTGGTGGPGTPPPPPPPPPPFPPPPPPVGYPPSGPGHPPSVFPVTRVYNDIDNIITFVMDAGELSQAAASDRFLVAQIKNTNSLSQLATQIRNAGIANANIPLAKTFADFLKVIVSDSDLVFIGENGRCGIMYSAHNTAAQLAARRLAITSSGGVCFTGAQAKTAIQLILGDTSGNAVVIKKLIGYSESLAVITRGSALSSRLRLGFAVAGVFGSVILNAAPVALTVINAMPFAASTYYTQGRLQLVNTVAETDAQRNGIGNVIYYCPISTSNPGQCQVTLGSVIGVPGTRAFRIADVFGVVPSLNLSQVSPVPFTIAFSRAWTYAAVVAGRPIDIFCHEPAVTPDDGALAALQGGSPLPLFFNTLNTIQNGPFTGRRDESFAASAPNQLPRLFYLTWKSATARRVGGFGHYLTWSPFDVGLCLGVPLASQTCYDGFPGYLTTSKDSRQYKYLGTVYPVNAQGVCICMPGARFVWNANMRLPYNDFRIDPYKAFAINSLRSPGSLDLMRPLDLVNIWKHHFINPVGGEPSGGTAGSGVWTGAAPGLGSYKIGLCGPLGLQIKLNDTILQSPNAGGTVCAYSEISGNAVSPGTLANGLNIIEAKSTLPTGNSPAGKNWAYIGTGNHVWYKRDYGLVADTSSLNDPIIHLWNLAGLDIRLDEDSQPFSQKGFGFQGEC